MFPWPLGSQDIILLNIKIMNVNITPKELQLIQFTHWINTHHWIGALFGVLIVWTLVWKGIALWKATREGRKDWFIILLVVNTVGILEIAYIFFFSKKKSQSQ